MKIYRWHGKALGLMLLLLVAGIIYQRVASTNDQATYPPPGKLVEVSGREMHLYCIGTGSPTVVLESGLGETLLNWSKVQAEAALFTRVCAYDRAGFGWSEPADEPIHLAESWADTNSHLSSAQRQMLIATQNQSHYCRATAHEEAAADTDMSQPSLKSLGDVPLIVLTATQTVNRLADELPAELVEEVNALWSEKQLELAALSTNSSQVIATESAHYIQYDQPELVIEAIRQMVLGINREGS